MANRPLSDEEVTEVLEACRIATYVFGTAEKPYLFRLGYVLYNGSLWGTTTEGKKTELAELNPNVAFQIDDSIDHGPWGWSSVVGRGVFEIVDDQQRRAQVIPLIADRFTDAPDWARHEMRGQYDSGELLLYKVTIEAIAGVSDEDLS